MLPSLMLTSLLFPLSSALSTQTTTTTQKDTIDTGPFPADLNGSNFTYPWPIKLFRFTSQSQPLEMAFMDIIAPPSSSKQPPHPKPKNKNNPQPQKVALLLHGGNFCAATWRTTAVSLLLQSGSYNRIIIPDQIGFCKSSKPTTYQFTLHQLALNTFSLLSALNLTNTSKTNLTIIGHSLGGMLATRLVLSHHPSLPPSSLVLINPIGLEHWTAKGVPYPGIDTLLQTELTTTYDSIRSYQQSTYYPDTEWTREFDEPVRMLASIYAGSKAKAFAHNRALVTDMVLTQTVLYEWPLIKAKRTLLLIGTRDTTAIGKAWAPPEVQATLGHYEVLGKEAAAAIPGAELIEFGDLGHVPQMQDPERLHAALVGWLRKGE